MLALINTMPRFLLFTCLFILTLSLVAQPTDEIEFGKISQADREMMVCPVDSSAEAYTLHDQLFLEIIQNNDGAPVLREQRHRRIKLLKPASFDRADVELIYWREHQRITGLKAAIHLPSGGIIMLQGGDFIRERYDDDRDIYKFTFPRVTEGAVIEYAYTQYDDYITAPSRYFFQEDIPVRRAEYKAQIPMYFNYISLGTTRSEQTITKTKAFNGTYGANQVQYLLAQWAYDDLPAYEYQPYTNNFSDYLPQVRLQLQAVQYPGRPLFKIFSDWEDTVKKLDESASFGKAYRNRGKFNRAWNAFEPIVAGMSTEADKIQAAYNFVAGRISWDGSYSFQAHQSLNKVFDNSSGTSGEMNLLLLGLLREAGINAQPVLVSLRNRGAPVELYPIMTQFDHVMVLAELGDGKVMLDANSPSRPVGLPRVSALNHRAFVADPDRPLWIDVQVPKSSQTVMADVSLSEEGMGAVKIKSRMKEYFAISGRTQLREKEEDADLPLVADIVEIFPETELVNHAVKDPEVFAGPLTMNMELRVPMGQAFEDYLYVQPILVTVLDKELAEVEQRIYPVDFSYPWQQRYITNLTIPEGYTVEELPESVRMRSEDGSISCTFAAEEKADHTVSINFIVDVSRTVYPAQEYPVLKDIFRQIIDMQSAIIVLKRAK